MRHLLGFIVISFGLSFSSCGQENKTHNKEKNYALSHLIPKQPIGWVSDFEHIFTESEVNYLDSLISIHKANTTNELSLVTLNLDTSSIKSPEDFGQFSLKMFNAWGIGEKGKNNGIGVLMSPNLKMIRIEIGYGLNIKLTDEEAKQIIDRIIIPEFKNGNYFIGISKGLDAIFNEIK